MHTRTNHQARHRGRSRLVATATALLLASASLLMISAPPSSATDPSPPTTSSPPPSLPHLTTAGGHSADELFRCQPGVHYTTIHAQLRQGGGSTVMAHRTVRLYRHQAVKPLVVHPSASAVSGRSGQITWRLRHTPLLAEYAANHRGRLNLDLVNLHFSQRYSRSLSIPYCVTARPLGVLHLAHTAQYVVKGEPGKVDPDQFPPPEYPGHPRPWIVTVPVSHIETTKGVTVATNFSSETTHSISAGFGASGAWWSLSGSITVAGTDGGGSSDALTLDDRRGIVYGRAVKLSLQRVCEWDPMHIVSSCSYETTAVYSGNHDYHAQYVRYRPCSWARDVWTIRWARTDVAHRFDYNKSHGSTLTAQVSAGILHWTITASGTWERDTFEDYAFHRTGAHVDNYYCIGGVGGPYDAASSSWLVAGSSPKRAKG